MRNYAVSVGKHQHQRRMADAISEFMEHPTSAIKDATGLFTVRWPGKPTQIHFESVEYENHTYNVGDHVYLANPEGSSPYIAQIVALFMNNSGENMLRAKWYFRPEDTKDTKKKARKTQEREIFESQEFDDNPIGSIHGLCYVKHMKEVNSYKEWTKEDDHYFYQYLYSPSSGTWHNSPAPIITINLDSDESGDEGKVNGVQKRKEPDDSPLPDVTVEASVEEGDSSVPTRSSKRLRAKLDPSFELLAELDSNDYKSKLRSKDKATEPPSPIPMQLPIEEEDTEEEPENVKLGELLYKDEETGKEFYSSFEYMGNRYTEGDCVELRPDDPGVLPYVCKIISISIDGEIPVICGRWFYQHYELAPSVRSTNYENEGELYASLDADYNPISSITNACCVRNVRDIDDLRKYTSEHRNYYFRSWYDKTKQELNEIEPLPFAYVTIVETEIPPHLLPPPPTTTPRSHKKKDRSKKRKSAETDGSVESKSKKTKKDKAKEKGKEKALDKNKQRDKKDKEKDKERDKKDKKKEKKKEKTKNKKRKGEGVEEGEEKDAEEDTQKDEAEDKKDKQDKQEKKKPKEKDKEKAQEKDKEKEKNNDTEKKKKKKKKEKETAKEKEDEKEKGENNDQDQEKEKEKGVDGNEQESREKQAEKEAQKTKAKEKKKEKRATTARKTTSIESLPTVDVTWGDGPKDWLFVVEEPEWEPIPKPKPPPKPKAVARKKAAHVPKNKEDNNTDNKDAEGESKAPDSTEKEKEKEKPPNKKKKDDKEKGKEKQKTKRKTKQPETAKSPNATKAPIVIGNIITSEERAKIMATTKEITENNTTTKEIENNTTKETTENNATTTPVQTNQTDSGKEYAEALEKELAEASEKRIENELEKAIEQMTQTETEKARETQGESATVGQD